MNYTKLSDNDLVDLSAGGDGDAFEMLVRRHGGMVMGLALSRLGDRAKSEDIVQDAFLRVFRKLSEYNRKAKFSTWLYRIASNLIKDNFKYARRHPVSPLTTEQVGTDLRLGRSPAEADSSARKAEKRRFVMDALRELRDDMREILILRDVHGMSYGNIAETAQCTLGTVKSRVSRARMKFKDIYVKLLNEQKSG